MFFMCTKFIPAGGDMIWYYPMVDHVRGGRVDMLLVRSCFAGTNGRASPQG